MIPERTHKRCPRCQGWLPLSDFPPNPKLRSGRHSYCRSCRDEYRREWREAHPEELARYNAKLRLGERQRDCVDCGQTFTFKSTLAVRCLPCRRQRKLEQRMTR
jgi:hypothetical protein